MARAARRTSAATRPRPRGAQEGHDVGVQGEHPVDVAVAAEHVDRHRAGLHRDPAVLGHQRRCRRGSPGPRRVPRPAGRRARRRRCSPRPRTASRHPSCGRRAGARGPSRPPRRRSSPPSRESTPKTDHSRPARRASRGCARSRGGRPRGRPGGSGPTRGCMARSRARSGALVHAATTPSRRRIDSPGSPADSLSRARIDARSVRSTVRSCSTARAIASSATASASPGEPPSMRASARRARRKTRSGTGASSESRPRASSVRASRSTCSSVIRAAKARAPSSSARSWSVGSSVASRARRSAMARPVRPLPFAADAARRVSAWVDPRSASHERDRGLVVRQGLGRAAHPLGGVAGPHRRLEGRGAVAGGQRVAGQVGGGAQGGVLDRASAHARCSWRRSAGSRSSVTASASRAWRNS